LIIAAHADKSLLASLEFDAQDHELVKDLYFAPLAKFTDEPIASTIASIEAKHHFAADGGWALAVKADCLFFRLQHEQAYELTKRYWWC
jgi:hypothetical protein